PAEDDGPDTPILADPSFALDLDLGQSGVGTQQLGNCRPPVQPDSGSSHVIRVDAEEVCEYGCIPTVPRGDEIVEEPGKCLLHGNRLALPGFSGAALLLCIGGHSN